MSIDSFTTHCQLVQQCMFIHRSLQQPLLLCYLDDDVMMMSIVNDVMLMSFMHDVKVLSLE